MSIERVVQALTEEEMLNLIERNKDQILTLQLQNKVLQIHLRLYRDKKHREQETIYKEKELPTAIGQAH